MTVIDRVHIASATRRGVLLTSRHYLRYEYERMEKVIDLLPEHLLLALAELWCDSKACDTYSVYLTPGTGEREAWLLFAALHDALVEVAGGHNGIYPGWTYRTSDSTEPFIECYWQSDDEELP